MNLDDTIAAIATPLGEAGLAVIRVSGPNAFAVADASFQGKTKPSEAATHTVHYGWIVRGGEKIDEVMLTILRAPRSFTGEHTVEVSCHGGVLTTKLVLDTLLQNGARLAQPGEFTRRAFLNGRLDLTQAEAVIDLIHARTDRALRVANEQLAGHLAQRINALRDSLMLVLAHVEAHIDFPDEDISPDTQEQLLARLQTALETIGGLLRTAREGQILRHGIRAAIIGRPNAGKSSLLNCLLGRDRAIVSPTPGTTRDTIEETANIRGIPVIFIDTAGIRESADALEKEGIRRTYEKLESAEIILHVVDQSEPADALDTRFAAENLNLTERKQSLITVLNKSDLPAQNHAPAPAEAASGRTLAPHAIPISCRTGDGLEALKDAIQSAAGSSATESHEVMINARHEAALRRARSGIEHTIEALSAGASLELAALDLRLAVNAIGEIVGKTTTEDLLDAIFSQFCLGK